MVGNSGSNDCCRWLERAGSVGCSRLCRSALRASLANSLKLVTLKTLLVMPKIARQKAGGTDDLAQYCSRSGQLNASRGARIAAHVQAIHPFDDRCLHARRHGRLRIILVAHGDVVELVGLPAPWLGACRDP